MEDMGEKVAAHEATLTQMNQRLGSIEATLREMNGQFVAGLRDVNTRMATTGELRAWMSLVIGLIAVAVGVILKFG